MLNLTAWWLGNELHTGYYSISIDVGRAAVLVPVPVVLVFGTEPRLRYKGVVLRSSKTSLEHVFIFVHFSASKKDPGKGLQPPAVRHSEEDTVRWRRERENSSPSSITAADS